MQENKTLSRAEWLDKIFGTPVFAVLLAIFCNVLWLSLIHISEPTRRS